MNSARGNLFYGVCNPATDAGCTSPAHAEAAPDTAKNSQLFLADSGYRGDIARAVMYMTLRYRGTESNTFLLTLSDCPCSDNQRFGNLTTLYSWHTADAVDSREQLRNQLTCENWQHNRNPFVDFPDLVDYFYDYVRDAGLLHAGCGEPCAPPDEEDDDGAPDCDGCSLDVGDVVVLGFNSDDPDEVCGGVQRSPAWWLYHPCGMIHLVTGWYCSCVRSDLFVAAGRSARWPQVHGALFGDPRCDLCSVDDVALLCSRTTDHRWRMGRNRAAYDRGLCAVHCSCWRCLSR